MRRSFLIWQTLIALRKSWPKTHCSSHRCKLPNRKSCNMWIEALLHLYSLQLQGDTCACNDGIVHSVTACASFLLAFSQHKICGKWFHSGTRPVNHQCQVILFFLSPWVLYPCSHNNSHVCKLLFFFARSSLEYKVPICIAM